MKTVLTVLCWFCVVVMLNGCDNGDDGGTAGARGDFPDVSFTVDENGNVTCWNADKNVITTRQICTWNCAYYEGMSPRKVTLWFDEAPVCIPTGVVTVDPDTGEETIEQECNIETALVKVDYAPCML